MGTHTRMTVLADNTVVGRHVLGEHGLALWIDTGDRRLLFDTGQGMVLADNAQELGLDLASIDAIILSHGHYDHTGGLAGVLRQATHPVAVHAHSDALQPKYQRSEAGIRDIGMPVASREAMRGSRCCFVPSRQPIEVASGLWTTGEIPRRHPQETIPASFRRDPEGRQPDLLLDDQALFLETAQGTVVLLGCAHAGLLNTLDHIHELTDGRPMHAIIGGLHLRSASAARLAWTIDELRRFTIDLLVPMHCTGLPAVAALWAAFPHACQPGGVGVTFDFQ